MRDRSERWSKATSSIERNPISFRQEWEWQNASAGRHRARIGAQRTQRVFQYLQSVEEAHPIDTFKQTLRTLANHQGPQGEIPSKVDKVSGRVSYGGTTGRVDADLWFVIGCAEYWQASHDEKFLDEVFPVLDQVDFLLRAGEFNNRGLLFVPPAGDWADEYIQNRVDQFISELVRGRPQLLPAFHPVIEPVDEDWEHLQVTYSYTFRNQPYEYHNGGLWPMVTGFYVADLAARFKEDEAEMFLNGIHWANSLPQDDKPWSFPEYVHGLNFTAGGTRQQAWSAAAAVIAHQAIQGKPLFQVKGNNP